MNTKHTFKKEERISSEKDIELLFEAGSSFKMFPLRVVFINKPTRTNGNGLSVLISVSKKKFKHAVDRNRIKRLIRESYRLNNRELLDFTKDKDSDLLIAFLYMKQEICEYQEIEGAMKKALSELKEKLMK